jgi:hypothetical protein
LCKGFARKGLISHRGGGREGIGPTGLMKCGIENPGNKTFLRNLSIPLQNQLLSLPRLSQTDQSQEELDTLRVNKHFSLRVRKQFP